MIIRKTVFLAPVISIFLVLFTFTAGGALPQSVAGQELPSLAPMLEKVTPAVVNIATEGRIQLRQNPLFNDPFFRHFFDFPDQPIERKTQSLGSGVIVDAKRGLVLTNNHVIANAVEITVTLRDGRHLNAEVIGTDPETDVAVIRIPAEDLTDIETSDSDVLRVGDFVVAIGNPFGLGQTVTSGIVSALGRSGLGIEGIEDFIQTDASINPGNSGGALVNLRGELVGINTAIFSQSGGNIGIGFAIPINLALDITEQLLETGEVRRGYLGVYAQDLDKDLAEAFGLKKNTGAVISKIIKDSPAEKAGLKPGDIVLKVDDKPVRHSADVKNHIGMLRIGERVEFEIMRGGKRKTIDVVIEAPEKGQPMAVNQRLQGMTLADLDENHTLFGQVEGVIIADVERGSPAWASGLRRGDIITSVNHKPVRSVEEFLAEVDNQTDPLLIRMIRGNAAAFVVIK